MAIFETLLDLPILSAVLEGQLRDANVGPTTDPTERAVRGVEVFTYILEYYETLNLRTSNTGTHISTTREIYSGLR